jgi:hypothetical protein
LLRRIKQYVLMYPVFAGYFGFDIMSGIISLYW